MTNDVPDRGPDAAPPTLLHLLQDLLGPEPAGGTAPATRRALAARRAALLVFAGAGLALYGLAAGSFGRGGNVALAALKVPLVVLFSFALCTPALVVLTALDGERWSATRLLDSAAAFLASLALVLLGLLPVSWLFSVSSRHLASVVVLHLAAWLVALALARRALRRASELRRRGAFRAWTLLLLLVSLQAATFLQPVLWRSPGESLFPRPRQLFFDHFADAIRIRWPKPPERGAPAPDAESVTRPEARP
jgi:hypothetical protein